MEVEKYMDSGNDNDQKQKEIKTQTSDAYSFRHKNLLRGFVCVFIIRSRNRQLYLFVEQYQSIVCQFIFCGKSDR